jgi:xanthine dehydrogenase molybdopterin-binding subunit B
MSRQLDRRAEELRLRVVRRALRHDSAPKHVAAARASSTTSASRKAAAHRGRRRADRGGHLLGIDLDAVRAAPGVVAVLTAADIPGKNDVGPVLHDDPVFVDGRIEFYGQSCSRWSQRTRGGRAVPVPACESRGQRSATPYISVGPDCARRRRHKPARLHVPQGMTARPRWKRARGAVKEKLRIGGQGTLLSRRPGVARHPGEDGDMLVHVSTQHPSECQHLIAKVLKFRTRGHRRGAPHGRRVRRQGDACRQWAAIARSPRASPAAVQDPARPRRRHVASTGKAATTSSADYEHRFDGTGRHPRARRP